jgi:HD-GYP domain-containing protein (c-di-GMP phosphodiesterase class II)
MANTPETTLQILEKALRGGFRNLGNGYYEIPTKIFVSKVDLKLPSLPEIAFYAQKPGSDSVELLRTSDQPYSALALSAFENVLIKEADLAVLKKHSEARLLSATTQTKGGEPAEKRMESLRRTAITVVDDLFQNPSASNIVRSARVVGSFVYVMMREPESYLHLARLSSHDPYTLQHSVGAAVNSIILARKMGIKDEKELEEVGMGGLLHDIGKVRVKKEIINKPGPLNDEEWVEMKQHSLWGYEIIHDAPNVTERSKLAVLEHHEDRTGQGYPHRKEWNSVHTFAKIVCIADIFNALTTNRSYSASRTPFEALQLMREKMIQKLDEELFRNMVLIYGGKIEDLKAEALPPSTEGKKAA